MTAYQYTLSFTKVFDQNHTLAGLTYEDTLGVSSEADGHKAVENYRKLASRNGYTVSDYHITRN